MDHHGNEKISSNAPRTRVIVKSGANLETVRSEKVSRPLVEHMNKDKENSDTSAIPQLLWAAKTGNVATVSSILSNQGVDSDNYPNAEDTERNNCKTQYKI